VQAVLPSLATAAGAVWALQHAEQAAAWSLPLVLLVFISCWRAARPKPVELRFDGSSWLLHDIVGSVDVLIDISSFLLLRWRARNGAGSRYLALTAVEIGPSMHGLRVALYAPGRAAPTAGR